MAEEKCTKCGMPLGEADKCSCEPMVCCHCCACPPECDCGCEAKGKESSETPSI